MTFFEVAISILKKLINYRNTSSNHLCLREHCMERLLNQYDMEYMKMAMLKQEETFRDQVYELHRLYRVQKMMMKDTAGNRHCRIRNQPESRGAEAFSLEESGGKKCRVSSEMELEYDLELKLGPRSYYDDEKKMKAAEGGIQSDSFSWSPSTGSSHMKGGRSRSRSTLQKWGPETPVSNQDRLNSPPWLIQALSLNMA